MANISPDSMLTRDKSAAVLSELGYPVTKATLATLASRGGGPIYRHFGKRVLYRWSDLTEWAEARCCEAIGSSSESEVANHRR